jgi:hypothetical protein
VGHVEVLSPHVRIEVTGIRRTRKGEWSLQYTLWDQRRDRTRYLVPAGFHSVPITEDGKPAPMTPEEELGYTTNPARALEPGVPSVSLADQNVLNMQARNRFAEHRERERAEEMARRDLRVLTSTVKQTAITMARNGSDPSVLLADLQRVLQVHQRSELDRVA